MSERQRRLAQARGRESAIKGEQARLVKLITKGVMSDDDPVFQNEFEALKLQRRAVADEIVTLEAAISASGQTITADKIERLGQLLRTALRSEDPALRKAYVRMFVHTVVVGDNVIEVHGPKSVLVHASQKEGMKPNLVPSFVREWHAKQYQ